MYSSVPQISAQLHFLKAQVLLASGETVETGLNMLQTSLLSSPTHSSNAWQVTLQLKSHFPFHKLGVIFICLGRSIRLFITWPVKNRLHNPLWKNHYESRGVDVSRSRKRRSVPRSYSFFCKKRKHFKKFNLKENIKEKVSLVSRAVTHGPYVMTSYQIISRSARPKSVNWYNFLCYISLCD